mgnify:CR=1 FL=1
MKYVEYGQENKEVIIFLHGGGLSWWNYREVAELLQDDYHVVLPILNGHAGSDKDFVSIEENADGIIAFIDEKFGSSVLNGDQTINRGKLGKIVFADEGLLAELNKIIHPRVKSHIVSEIAKERAYHRTKYFVVEAALLIEDHYDVICDEMWYIHTDASVRAERLKETRGYDDEKIASICANQKSPEEFRSGCQVVIDNSGDLADTQKQIDEQLGR